MNPPSLKERKEKLALKILVYAKQHDLIGDRDLKLVLHTLQKPLTEAQLTELEKKASDLMYLTN